MGLTTISTYALSTFWPPTFCKTDYGCIYVNGLNRGRRYDGVKTLDQDLGIDQPSAAPTLATSSAGSNSYVCGYRYVDDTLPTGIPGPLSALATITGSATSGITYTWSSLSAAPAALFDTPGQRDRVRKVQFFRSTAGITSVLYYIFELGSDGAVTSSANAAGNIRLTLPVGHNLTAGARITVSGHSEASVNATHVITTVTSTTATTSTAFVATGTGGTWVLAGYAESTSDANLAASLALPILNQDTTLNARRFVAPPDDMSVVVMHQERAWYAVPVFYNSGTVNVSNGSATVGGTGFTSAFAGRYLWVAGETRGYEISGVSSATSLTLTENYTGTNNATASFVICPATDRLDLLFFSEVAEPESVPMERLTSGILSGNALTIVQQTPEKDTITGLMPYGDFLYVLMKAHVYRVTYGSTPDCNCQTGLVAERGCVNQHCWVIADGTAYMLDSRGIWAMTDGGARPLSGDFQDYFRDSDLDWSTSKWWSAGHDPVAQCIKFYVSFSGETYPKHAFVLHYASGEWHTETYHTSIGGACIAEISSKQRLLVGAQGDIVYLTGNGTFDGVTNGGSRAVTSATDSTVVDSDGPFVAARDIGAAIAITSGTGKGQVRRISNVTVANTTATVDVNWTTTPDSTSRYAVGGIPWSFKTGVFDLAPVDYDNLRRIEIDFDPIASTGDQSNTFDVRRFVNNSSTAENNPISTIKDGVTYTTGDPDAVVAMRGDSVLGALSGRRWLDISDNANPETEGVKFAQIEVRGVQTDLAHVIYDVTIYGVKG